MVFLVNKKFLDETLYGFYLDFCKGELSLYLYVFFITIQLAKVSGCCDP